MNATMAPPSVSGENRRPDGCGFGLDSSESKTTKSVTTDVLRASAWVMAATRRGSLYWSKSAWEASDAGATWKMGTTSAMPVALYGTKLEAPMCVRPPATGTPGCAAVAAKDSHPGRSAGAKTGSNATRRESAASSSGEAAARKVGRETFGQGRPLGAGDENAPASVSPAARVRFSPDTKEKTTELATPCAWDVKSLSSAFLEWDRTHNAA